jgi:hypothetical protein
MKKIYILIIFVFISVIISVLYLNYKGPISVTFQSYHDEFFYQNRTLDNAYLENQTKNFFENASKTSTENASKTLTEKIEIEPEKIEKFSNWYKEMHEKSINDLKVIVYDSTQGGGLGNVINGLISSLLVSVLTERALLTSQNQGSMVFDFFLSRSWENYEHLIKSLSSFDDSNYCFFKEESVKKFETEDLNSIFGKQSFRWTTNCPLFHWIARNPKYTEKIKKLGMVPENATVKEYGYYVAVFLSKCLLHKLREPYNTLIEKKIREDFSQSFVVGLQIRTGYLDNGDQRFLSSQQIEAIWNCSETLSKGNDTKFFVASDNPDVINYANSKFKDKLIKVEGPLEHVRGHKVGDGLARAVVEMKLLGYCDEIIITSASTFGSSAVLLAGKVPLWINTDLQCIPTTKEEGPGGRLPNSLIWK